MGSKPVFQFYFLCKEKAENIVIEAELIRDFFNILSLNKNWARLSSRVELAQQQRGATRAARMGSTLHQDHSDMQNESILHHTNRVLKMVTPQPMLSKT